MSTSTFSNRKAEERRCGHLTNIVTGVRWVRFIPPLSQRHIGNSKEFESTGYVIARLYDGNVVALDEQCLLPELCTLGTV